MHIGDVIASVRRRRRVYQNKLALDLGITGSYLSQIENNVRIPGAKMLSEIANQLDIPLSVLLFEVVLSTEKESEQTRELFLKARPLIDKLISILLSENTADEKAG